MPFLQPFIKYVDFSGRATRLEFWSFTVMNFIIALVLYLLAFTVGWGFFIIVVVYGIAVFLPTWGVWVRRLHDTGRSGWWLLLGAIPLAFIVLYIFALMDSDGDNEYGPTP